MPLEASGASGVHAEPFDQLIGTGTHLPFTEAYAPDSVEPLAVFDQPDQPTALLPRERK